MHIRVIKEDITKLKVDAIVNAAKNSLLGGGGVDGAIHAAGGSQILKECKAIGFCETGEVVYTTAGNLKARYLIHTVGPVYVKNEPKEAAILLHYAYENALLLAEKLACKTIAFPNISTGIYGFPKDKAVKIVYDVIKKNDRLSSVQECIFCCFDEENYQLYKQTFKV